MLISRVCKNKATEYEMLLYQLALQHDAHFSETVRRLQLDWIGDEREPNTLERLRRANRRLNKREKLPPWGSPLIKGDSLPRQLRRCGCRLVCEKVPWNAPTYWEGASTELRDALAKRAVRTDSPQAAITSQNPRALRPLSGSGVQSRSQELSALVRAAAGSADRRERCTKLNKENDSDEDICRSCFYYSKDKI